MIHKEKNKPFRAHVKRKYVNLWHSKMLQLISNHSEVPNVHFSAVRADAAKRSTFHKTWDDWMELRHNTASILALLNVLVLYLVWVFSAYHGGEKERGGFTSKVWTLQPKGTKTVGTSKYWEIQGITFNIRYWWTRIFSRQFMNISIC